MTRLVITQGDPEGIGPELLLRVADAGLLHEGDLVVAGRDDLRDAAEHIDQAWAVRGLARLEPMLVGPDRLGQYAALELGVDRMLAAPREHALVTAPIDKARANAEGLRHPGHTEYLAERAGTDEFAMLMAGPILRVVLATIHVPLQRVAALLSGEAIARAGRLLARALVEDFAIRPAKIGVLGLNPHAGEQGLLGREEIEVIGPAIEALRAWASAQALPVEFVGPLPADGGFPRHRAGDLDGLIAMYHDQGLAPFKLLHFHDGVNVTLGLPFVRTSPDHGTARDIAGRGIADASSMIAAIELARTLAAARARST
ncbi:4-hydroxythreonine-4-phosphate dehydrogenase PdxA [Nannocystaceae bacterium ST9]